MIKLVIFDIDGVVTDGTVIIDENGNEQKKVNLKDIDAIYHLKKSGYKIAAITGEDSPIVKYFKNRFPWDFFYQGKKNKIESIKVIEEQLIIDRNEICYIGDGKYDVEPLSYAGLGICPLDAIDKAKQASKIILSSKAGEGGLWELNHILNGFNKENASQYYFYQRLLEHEDIFKRMASDEKLISDVMHVGDEMIELLNNKNQIFLCGNGGSAADAQHIATELVSRFYKERKALNAEALTVNTSTLTAIGNDYNYNRIFTRQLEAKAKRGDMLIGLSTSGKSKNVIDALTYAKECGLTTVLLMGDFDNDLEVVDYMIKIPSKITPRIQEAHIFVGHLVCEYVEEKMFNN